METRVEYMDGDDNDCDGYVPVFELDCDDDGALPILPRRVSLAQDATEIDMVRCDETEGYDEANPYKYIECWDQKLIQLECDSDYAGGVGSVASGCFAMKSRKTGMVVVTMVVTGPRRAHGLRFGGGL